MQNPNAKPASSVVRSMNDIKHVCDVTKNLGHFQHKGRLVINDDKYKASCGRVNISNTGALDRSSLELKVLGHDPQRWERVQLTLNTDKDDLDANKAFREAAYRLMGDQVKSKADQSEMFNLTYEDDFFKHIHNGVYRDHVPGLKGNVKGSITHEYNRRGGTRVTLDLVQRS